jgi:acetylornithine deacetylase/succinyl-diaminopimelate desuccinylase-like protein
MKLNRAETFLRDLVEIPSVNSKDFRDDAACDQTLDYISEVLDSSGLTVKRIPYSTQRIDGVEQKLQALVATSRETKEPKTMLVAHSDVVPASTEEQFVLREQNGRFYGRGVYDMKFAIAAYLASVEALPGNITDYDIAVGIVTDEETGGLGARTILNDGYIPESAFVLDSCENWQLEKSVKGAWTPIASVGGIAAHGSRPWEGESASFKLLDLLNELRSHFKDQSIDTDTLNISILESGIAQNVVPDRAKATLDIRLSEADSYAKNRSLVIELFQKYGADLDLLDTAAYFPHIERSLDDEYTQAFIKIVKELTGVTSDSHKSLGSNDSVHFSKKGIPCIVTRPNGDGVHMDSEWIDRKQFNQTAPILTRFMIDKCLMKSD